MTEYINKAELMEKYPEFDGYTFADVTTIEIPEEPYFETEAEGIAYLVGAFSVALDIVHCSECIHAKLNWADGEYYCARHQDVFVKDYFCADGER